MKHLALLATFFIAPLLHGAGRHALILCNQNYQAVRALKTPLAEAKAAEETLSSLGFQGNITVITDATTAKMTEAVDTFAAKLEKADVALFFYGGHAIQAAGENYLLGVDSDPATSSQLAYKALPLGRVLTNLEGSGARLNLLILDCCRDNPLPTRGRNVGGTRGLAPLANAPRGTFIAFAADANQQAWDDHGTTGLYGSVLFEKMRTPGLRLEDIFIQTREDVARIANEKYQHQQEPAEYSKVSGAFYFLSAHQPAVVAAPVLPTNKPAIAPPPPKKPIQWVKGPLRVELTSFSLHGPTQAAVTVKIQNTLKDKTLKVSLAWMKPDPFIYPNLSQECSVRTAAGAKLVCLSTSGVQSRLFPTDQPQYYDKKGILRDALEMIGEVADLGPQESVTLNLDYGLIDPNMGLHKDVDKGHAPPQNSRSDPASSHHLVIPLWYSEVLSRGFSKPVRATVQLENIPATPGA